MLNKCEQEILKVVNLGKNIKITQYPLYYMVDDLLIREDQDGSKYIVKFDNNKQEIILGPYNDK